MPNSTVIERIRKLLAMANDVSSPEEAAIAAGRARKMMDKHQVSELDLTSVEASNFETESVSSGRKSADKPESILAATVANLNDCRASYLTGTDGKLSIVFKGMVGDAVCATLLFTYLCGEAKSQAKQKCKGRADIFAYRCGFANGVVNQINEILKERKKIVTSDNKSLVVCKQQLVDQQFGIVKYKSSKTKFAGDRDAFDAGVKAGQSANVSRSVESNVRTALG